MQAITINDLIVHNEVPTILDLRLAETLGYEEPRMIRKLIKRNVEELGRYGEVCATVSQTSPSGGRPGESFHLNEPQALLVCMKADTDKAADAREQIIRVFMAWRRGELRGPEPQQPGWFDDKRFTDPAASLSARVAAVSTATRLYGKAAARDLWVHLGLPEVSYEAHGPKPGRDREVLDIILEHRPNGSRSIREQLADALAGDVDCAEALPPHGVKSSPDTGGFYIGQSHPRIRALFKATPWADGSWLAALKRLAGGHHGGRIFFAGHRRFEGYQSRVIWLPASMLDQP